MKHGNLYWMDAADALHRSGLTGSGYVILPSTLGKCMIAAMLKQQGKGKDLPPFAAFELRSLENIDLKTKFKLITLEDALSRIERASSISVVRAQIQAYTRDQPCDIVIFDPNNLAVSQALV